MNNIKVTLLHHTPMSIAATAGRTCWNSFHKGGVYEIPSVCTEVDSEFIDRVINKFHHASIAEHTTFNFFIDGISRACLQEISRHRIASLSVKSTRYTLKELKSEEPFTEYTDMNDQEYLPTGRERAEKYLVMTTDERVNRYSILALDNLRDLVATGMSNDLSKYAIPESYRTQLTWSINLRSLQNFLSLRTDKKALPEIQRLAHLIYAQLPVNAQSLVAHCIKE